MAADQSGEWCYVKWIESAGSDFYVQASILEILMIFIIKKQKNLFPTLWIPNGESRNTIIRSQLTRTVIHKYKRFPPQPLVNLTKGEIASSLNKLYTEIDQYEKRFIEGVSGMTYNQVKVFSKIKRANIIQLSEEIITEIRRQNRINIDGYCNRRMFEDTWGLKWDIPD